MIEELSWTLSAHASRIQEAIQAPGLHKPAVFQRVLVGLAMDQPLEAIFFPGILDGLTKRLGLMPPGVVDPPTSARAGMSRCWAATLREAVMRNEGRDINPEPATPHVVHPGLHQDYDLDFRTQRVDDIAPTLTSPLLSGLVSNVHLLGRPEVPREPVSSKAEEGPWGHSGAPIRPGAPAPPAMVGQYPICKQAKWRPQRTSCMIRERSILIKPSLGLTQRKWPPLSYWMMMKLTFPLICFGLSPRQNVNQPGTRSDPWRTGVHAHPLQRSGQQKKRRGACLPLKQFYPEG